MKSLNRKLLIAFLLILVIKFIIVYFIPAPTTFSDYYNYAKMAQSFFHEQNFDIHGQNYLVYPPFYTIVISLSYIFNDIQNVYLMIKIINTILSSLIIFPAFLLAKEFLSEKNSYLISLIIAVLSSSFSLSSEIMAENLFYVLFLFSIYFIYSSIKTNSWKNYLIGLVLIILTILTKYSGIILILIFILSYGINFIQKKYKIKTSKVILYLTVSFAVLLVLYILLIENSSFFNEILKNIFKDYYAQVTGPFRDQLNYSFLGWFKNFAIWILLYIGYIILSTYIIFSLSSFFAYNKNNKNLSLFLLIVLITISLAVIMGANHNSSTINNPKCVDNGTIELCGRPIGRYIDSVLPLILISGFIGFKNLYNRLNKKTIILLVSFSLILLISSLLIFRQLYPINNNSLLWVGLLNLIVNYLLTGNLLLEFIPSNLNLIIMGIILAIIPIALYFLIKNTKKIIGHYFIILILFSLLNLGIIYYNSKTYWYESEQTKLGLEFNELDKSYSRVLFDNRDCGSLSKESQEYICGGIVEENRTYTIIGFWMHDDIRVDDISKVNEFDYLVSRHKLDFPVFLESNGIYIYKLN